MLLITLSFLTVGSFNILCPLASQLQHSRADYLLPSNLKPSLYQIEIEPNFETDTFRGSINITFTAESTTNKVVLHKDGLHIDNSSISLLNEEGNQLNSVVRTSYSYNDKYFYTITFEKNFIEKGVYTLVVGYFSGQLRNDNHGFNLGKYSDANNKERKFAVTHFEPVYARRAFPCLDEPAIKAQFDITIIRPIGYNSVSNMAKISESEISKGRFQDKFARSVKMSTYLVAFVISDFANVSHLNHRVFGRPALIAAKEGDFALQTGIKVLNTISEYLNISYSLNKMDQIGIPYNYFSSSGMENWGLVIYKEHLLLVHDKSSKDKATGIISHEFIHQWFGNLVSPIWWSYLWLKEGFATYLNYYIDSTIDNPNIMDIFVKLIFQTQLHSDSDITAVSMNYEAVSPTEINGKYRTSYNKPAAIIRMVQNTISPEVFRRGLNIYLNDMQFQAAHPRDLYNSWQKALDEANMNLFADNENISSFMTTWDSNAGYPLITVNRNYNNGTIIISQRRFLRDHIDNDDKSIWHVPITYTTSRSLNFSVTPPKLWLTSRSMEIVLDDLDPEDWLIVNVQQTGFYRVNYDEKNWQNIVDFSKKYPSKIHKMNRAQILDDTRPLSQLNLLKESIYKEILESIKYEIDFLPLSSFINSLESLDTYMSNTGNYEEFKDMVLNLLDTAINSVGFEEKENDDYITQLKRDMLITWVCKYGSLECKEQGRARIREWYRRDNEVIVSNLHASLLCTTLRNGEQNDWDFMFNKYKNEENSVLRERLLNALTCSENGANLARLLGIIEDDNNESTKYDLLNVLLALCNSGTYGRDYLYHYIKKNWTELSASLTTKDFESVIKCMASKFSTERQHSDLQALAEMMKMPAQSVFEEALLTIQSNIDEAQILVPFFINWIYENRTE